MAVTERRTRPDLSPGTLAEVLDRVLRVPDKFRVFAETGEDARRSHGIDAGLLATLTELGLPCRPASGGTRYDRLDLANVSLALRLPSARYMAMRGWSASIRGAASAEPVTYGLTVQPSCPSGHDGPCLVEADPMLHDLPGYATAPGGAFRLTRQVRGGKTGEFPEIAAFADLVREVKFHLLPDELSDDNGFLRESGLADCELASTFLVGQAAAYGLTVRRSFGLFLAVPYSIPHHWIDIRLDGEWRQFDPHLLNFLTGQGLLPPGEWPAHRCVGDIAWRLGEDRFQIAGHPGRIASVSFSTRILGT
jgi:hypothetical protein